MFCSNHITGSGRHLVNVTITCTITGGGGGAGPFFIPNSPEGLGFYATALASKLPFLLPLKDAQIMTWSAPAA